MTGREGRKPAADTGSPAADEIAPSEIGITGLKIVLGSGTSRARRLCWVAVLALTSALTFYQGLNRFQNFQSRPVTVSERIWTNETLPFPDVTICPHMTSGRHLLNPRKLEVLWRRTFPDRSFPTGDRPVLSQLNFRGSLESFLGYDTRVDEGPGFDHYPIGNDVPASGILEDEKVFENKTMTWSRQQRAVLVASALLAESLGPTALWNLSSYFEEGIFEKCHLGRGIPCRDRGRIESVMTVSGKCFTYKADRVNRGGMYHGLSLTLGSKYSTQTLPSSKPMPTSANPMQLLTAPFGWSVLVHGRRQSPETASFTHGYFVEGSGMEKAIAAHLRTFKAQNIPRKPCEENPTRIVNFCAVRSYERILASMATCRLPFMTMSDHYPECKTALEYLKATVISIDILEGHVRGKNGSRLIWGNDDACPQPCYRELFDMQSDTSAYDGGHESVVRVYFPELDFEEIVEEIQYGVIPFLCDFGGTLSLLMGASVLTMVEILEVVAARAICCLCSREIQQSKEQPHLHSDPKTSVTLADLKMSVPGKPISTGKN